MGNRPGGELAKRPLQFIWLVDCSGSMHGKKIESVNFAIREAIKPMQDVADENPNAQILVRTVKFSDGAQWHISQPTDIHDFKWTDLNADGVTDMAVGCRRRRRRKRPRVSWATLQATQKLKPRRWPPTARVWPRMRGQANAGAPAPGPQGSAWNSLH